MSTALLKIPQQITHRYEKICVQNKHKVVQRCSTIIIKWVNIKGMKTSMRLKMKTTFMAATYGFSNVLTANAEIEKACEINLYKQTLTQYSFTTAMILNWIRKLIKVLIRCHIMQCTYMYHNLIAIVSCYVNKTNLALHFEQQSLYFLKRKLKQLLFFFPHKVIT